jgi:hypothetical protein
MEQLQLILTNLDNKAITKDRAYDLILFLFDVSSNKVVICSRCGGQNEYIKTETGYICAFTDCMNEWSK